MSAPDDPQPNIRPLEEGIERDVGERNYGSYLQLDRLLGAQRPLSDHHDELLFIVQHQTTELWMKLVIHELRSAMALIAADDLAPALKRLARVKQIQRQMTDQWSVLATLTPTEYAQFRHVLGRASGFQSVQYRLLEFLLGNKNPAVLAVFAHDPDAQAELRAALEAPSLYDEFLCFLHRRGYPIPAALVERDWTRPHTLNRELVSLFAGVYEEAERQWTSTRPVRSSWTSRTPSRCGASATSRPSSGSSASSAAPAGPPASRSSSRRWI